MYQRGISAAAVAPLMSYSTHHTRGDGNRCKVSAWQHGVAVIVLQHSGQGVCHATLSTPYNLCGAEESESRKLDPPDVCVDLHT